MITASEHDLFVVVVVYFTIIIFSGSDFLFLLCVGVGLSAVVQRRPAVVYPVLLAQAAASASDALVCMSMNTYPSFAAQAFPPLGIVFKPYQTSIKQHGMY